MRRALKAALLLAGLAWFGWLLYRAGPAEVIEVLRQLRWSALLVFLPYALVYLFDTLGWRLAFDSQIARRVSLWRLGRVRWAGEAVNNLLPTGTVGGEALKVLLLKRAGVSGWLATAAAVNSKTMQVVAQVVFLGLGAGVGCTALPVGSKLRTAMLWIAGLSGLAIGMLFWLQRRGFSATLVRCASVWPALDRRLQPKAGHWRELDGQITAFYRQHRGRFALGTAVFLAGWLCDALELYVAALLLGWPIGFGEAIAIESFISVAKALGMFVPAAIGVQESGVMLLFRAFGLSAPQALAYALLRRGRELLYALAGLACLWAESKGHAGPDTQWRKVFQPCL
jgi:putative membrane protein